MTISESLPRVKRPNSLKEIAFKTIKDSIIKGSLVCGEIYSENFISKNLGISKTPVHEALLELSHKGFLIILPKKGFLVKDLSEKEIRDIYGYRLALEKHVILHVIEKIMKKDFTFLESILHKLKECNDIKKFLEEDIRFHRSLAGLAANDQIINALGEIWDLCIWVGFRTLSTQYGTNGVLDEHVAILDSIKTKDPFRAQAAIEKHINNSLDKILGTYHYT